MSNIAIPNSFTAYTVAASAEVNANFTEIQTKFNTYAVQKDVAATITAIHTYSTAPVFGFATASQALELDAGKAVQSVAITGTGNYVKSASPTFTGTIQAAAATLSGALTVGAAITADNATPLFALSISSAIVSALTHVGSALRINTEIGQGAINLATNGTTTRVSVPSSVSVGDVWLSVYDETGAALVRVSRGASDSGGVGYRLLRIPN